MERSLLKLLGVAVTSAWLLSGCATGYLLENDVQSFVTAPPITAPMSYRFERLPSQQAPGQAQLEAWADPALHAAGLQRDDANPRYSVQVTGRLTPTLSPWADPWLWDGGWGMGFHHHGFGFGMGGPWGPFDTPWYHREVAVIVRELPSHRVVYETHATSDGPWLDNAAVFPAMFSAAMHGFPNPPPGPRRVDILIGGKTTS
ncbi:MAG TPA: hypothetical protein VKD22_10385 [Ramlibacter sp.]|nr:hypothetical protein [Ramlibacter sp.]